VFCLVQEAYRDGGVVSPGSEFPRRVDGLFRVWRGSSLKEAPYGYDMAALRLDLARFAFLLTGEDGQRLFGREPGDET
jgi:hypothetical protein